jgi:hypothetical protein
MYRKILMLFGFLASMVTVGLITSCEQEEEISSTDNFVNTCIDSIQSRSGAGVFGCYELVFPVSIQFADSTTATVNSYEELREVIRNWFEANGGKPNHHRRPSLIFPYQVMNDAGEIITVADEVQLKDLLKLCKPRPGGHGGNGGGHHGGDACFTLVFPITLQFPDSTQLSVATPEEMRIALHDWKQNNPTTDGKPQFVFPLIVKLKDGTEVVVNTPEELRAIKEDCRG